jgi:hypothetical protein
MGREGSEDFLRHVVEKRFLETQAGGVKIVGLFASRSSILDVADQWVAVEGGLSPYLMGSPGVEPQCRER